LILLCTLVGSCDLMVITFTMLASFFRLHFRRTNLC